MNVYTSTLSYCMIPLIILKFPIGSTGNYIMYTTMYTYTRVSLGLMLWCKPNGKHAYQSGLFLFEPVSTNCLQDRHF